MKKYFKERKLNIALSLAAVLAMWLVWVIAFFAAGNEYIVPSAGQSFKSLGGLLISAEFWRALGYTLLNTLTAFAASFAVAAFLAALALGIKGFAAFLKPVTVFIRTVPTLAVILILLVWTNPRVTPVIVTALVLFPLIYSRILASYGGIDVKLTQMAAVYGLTPRDKIFKIYLPQIVPDLVAQTGSDLSLGLKIMVSAEVLASTRASFGMLMQNARLYVEMPRLAALTLAIVAAGLVLDLTFSFAARKAFVWRGGQNYD